MPEVSDMELLRDYDRQGSEEAFAELVRRHINLVYSVAFRHVGIAAQAEEITQAVFIILARKAAGLRPGTILEGWLYETTRLTALSFLRGERRRQFREQEAYVQSTLQESTDESVWNQLAPLLDEAMSRLGKKDRDAVVLRFFKERGVREVAAAMRITEAAAQRRVLRAVEKLRLFFTKRGIVLPAAVLTAVISANSVQAAPVALAKSVIAVAIAKGVAASGSTLTLIKGALKIMAWIKTKTAIVAGVAVLLVAGTATVTVKEIQEHRTYPWQVGGVGVDTALLDRVPPQVKIVPTKFPHSNKGGRSWTPDGRVIGINQSIEEVLQAAHGWTRSVQIVLAAKLSAGNYDFIANLPQGSMEALQLEAKKKFGLIARTEKRETDVFLLRVKYPDATGLRPSKSSNSDQRFRAGECFAVNQPLSALTGFLENNVLNIPVVDQTGLTGNFDFNLKWKADWQHLNIEGLKQAFIDQLGLELVPSREPIEMLIVEKTQ
jgi:uncharacterized protein (TIGR03435 family)